jgi:hypothetical protein
MAQGGKSLSAGAERNGRIGKLERPLGGTDFLIAWLGGDFNVPTRKAAWCDRQSYAGDGQTERQRTRRSLKRHTTLFAFAKTKMVLEKTCDCAWQIPGNGENSKCQTGRFRETDAKNIA